LYTKPKGRQFFFYTPVPQTLSITLRATTRCAREKALRSGFFFAFSQHQIQGDKMNVAMKKDEKERIKKHTIDKIETKEQAHLRQKYRVPVRTRKQK